MSLLNNLNWDVQLAGLGWTLKNEDINVWHSWTNTIKLRFEHNYMCLGIIIYVQNVLTCSNKWLYHPLSKHGTTTVCPQLVPCSQSDAEEILENNSATSWSKSRGGITIIIGVAYGLTQSNLDSHLCFNEPHILFIMLSFLVGHTGKCGCVDFGVCWLIKHK